MALTPNLALHYYGGEVPGSITDNASQHTGADRLFLDQVITQLAQAQRHYIPPTAALSPGASLVLNTTGGTLPNGIMLFYKVAVVGLDGFERMASAETGIATLPALVPPAVPGIRDSSGGALTPGLYSYALTAKSDAQESTLGSAATVTVYAGLNTTVLIDAPADTQDVPLQVWRKKDTDAGWTRLGIISASQTFADDGSIPAERYAREPGYAPPQSNAGGTNAISVTLTGDAADAAEAEQIKGWRIYRTTVSGYYGPQSLVHEVIEKDNSDGSELGPLRTTWVDTGDALATGTPQVKDRALTLTPYAVQVLQQLPTSAAGYPEGYPLLVGGGLYVKVGEAFVPAVAGSATGTGPAAVTTGVGVPATSTRTAGDLHLDYTTGTWHELLNGGAGAYWAPRWVPPTPPTQRVTLLSGSGSPTTATGITGDLYLDVAASPARLYGPKSAAGWPSTPLVLAATTEDPTDPGDPDAPAAGASPVLTAPDGSRWRTVVADDGTLSTVRTYEPGPPAAITDLQGA